MDSRELLEQVPAGAEVCMLASSAATATAAAANGSRSLGDMWLTGRAMSQAKLDVLLFPTIYSFVPTLTRAKKIVVVHDTIAETFPQLTLPNPKSRLFWQAKVRIGRAQADALVTVSEYSRRSIVKRFGMAPEQVFVVGRGERRGVPADPGCADHAGVSGGRHPAGEADGVYVGGFSPHKNLEALVEAFARIAGARGVSRTRCW